MKRRIPIPTTRGLLELLAARAVRTREALSAAGVKAGEVRRLNALKRRRWQAWEKGPDGAWRRKLKHGGRTYAGVDHSRKLALAGWKVLAARMAPGEWYAVSDMAALLPEYSYRSAKAWAVKLRGLGVTERTRNPDLDTSKPPSRQLEPVWLHRLTARGLELRQGWREALGLASELLD